METDFFGGGGGLLDRKKWEIKRKQMNNCAWKGSRGEQKGKVEGDVKGWDDERVD